MTDYNKLSLFENISKEEVVLFAGAGLSLDAGFPSGNTLRDIFFNSLNEAEKAQIIPNFQEIDENYVTQSLNLMDLTEAIYDLKGNRNHLIKVLRDVFNKKPTSLQVHENIAKIPHLKNIITTNYDTLFEDALGDTGEVILENSHIPYMDSKKRQIFKIHGDLNHIDRIILKKTDYNDFFKNNSENDIYWNLIKERLSTKAVMFIGYSLDDSNISVIFDKIIDSIGDDMKDVYFIAPSLSEPKRTKLIKKNIKYIESTGEEIFKEILQYLNNNIIKDLEKGNVAPNTVKSYTDKNFGLDISLKSNKAGFFLTNVYSGDKGLPPSKLNFTLKNDSIAKKLVEDIIKNGIAQDIELSKEDLESFGAWIGDLKIRDLSNIQNLKLVPIPQFKGTIDIIFENDEFELENLEVKIFIKKSTTNVYNFQIDSADFVIDLRITFDSDGGAKLNFNASLKEIISGVKSYLNFSTTLDKLSEGKQFSILHNGKTVFKQRYIQLPSTNGFIFFNQYFHLLREIEKEYGIKFSNININEVNIENYEKLREVKSKIDNSFIEVPFKNLAIVTSSDERLGVFHVLDDGENNSSNFMMIENDKKRVNIHGHDIVLGYKETHISNPIYSGGHPNSILDNDELIIKNKSEKLQYIYRDKTIDSIEE
ncbi:SIR2 family NAD-dependent protein deacylase [Elizabethkingia bruuniana]|uniref:SIR2 family NAD-dependent protein deacylase n=1 Tax=Elizabethkingia bruuniana TaxID=1756149 RepID=UPI00241C7BEA|nr:SIR2 family protein [Elizabethkingia bruuniana]